MRTLTTEQRCLSFQRVVIGIRAAIKHRDVEQTARTP